MKPNTHIPVKTDPSSFNGQGRLANAQQRFAMDICAYYKHKPLSPLALQTSKALSQRSVLNLGPKFNNKPKKPMYNLKNRLSLTHILKLLKTLLGSKKHPPCRHYPGTET